MQGCSWDFSKERGGECGPLVTHPGDCHADEQALCYYDWHFLDSRVFASKISTFIRFVYDSIDHFRYIKIQLDSEV